ncbi:MAG: ABC transporter family substrate-binding protein [Candidatus Dormibacteraeota bacterium]|nr:ABC transporter family substrate-binding protein [Candidatus Dormibacteraeota bacterium]
MPRGRAPGRGATAWGTRAAAVTAAVLLVAACGSSAGSGSGTKSGATLTFALDEDIAGFNVLNASEQEAVLAAMLTNVWPQVYTVNPDLKPHLNTQFVSSVKMTSTNPQTLVYQINPKATWSDGVPINAEDFIYNWQAQSGDPKYTDVGGQAFQPATTTGYSSIKSITGSNNGKTVTVVFSSPFADWQNLFRPMIPAHIAKKVGFNTGFSNFGPEAQVSGGPYMIQSYTKGQDLAEVPNPHYWGPAPKLGKLIYRFILDDSQQPAAAQNGEVQIVNPVIATIQFMGSIKSIPNFTSKVLPGLGYQHIDFNQANYYLANANIRHAIAYGTNRGEIVSRTADEIDHSIKPLGNRIYMASQPQYQNTSGSYGSYDPNKAKQLLQQAGMSMASDGYLHPSAGPLAGQDLTFTITSTSNNSVRQQIEELFQAEMKNIGIKINIQNYPANTLFGTVIPKGEFDITEFEWVQSPFASGTQALFCSYTNANLCGSNYDHYANPQVDKLLQQGVNSSNLTEEAKYMNQADALLWKDMVSLPLFQQPDYDAWSTKYANIVPDASDGLTWNNQAWAMKAAA